MFLLITAAREWLLIIIIGMATAAAKWKLSSRRKMSENGSGDDVPKMEGDGGAEADVSWLLRLAVFMNDPYVLIRVKIERHSLKYICQ